MVHGILNCAVDKEMRSILFLIALYIGKYGPWYSQLRCRQGNEVHGILNCGALLTSFTDSGNRGADYIICRLLPRLSFPHSTPSHTQAIRKNAYQVV